MARRRRADKPCLPPALLQFTPFCYISADTREFSPLCPGHTEAEKNRWRAHNAVKKNLDRRKDGAQDVCDGPAMRLVLTATQIFNERASTANGIEQIIAEAVSPEERLCTINRIKEGLDRRTRHANGQTSRPFSLFLFIWLALA